MSIASDQWQLLHDEKCEMIVRYLKSRCLSDFKRGIIHWVYEREIIDIFSPMDVEGLVFSGECLSTLSEQGKVETDFRTNFLSGKSEWLYRLTESEALRLTESEVEDGKL